MSFKGFKEPQKGANKSKIVHHILALCNAFRKNKSDQRVSRKTQKVVVNSAITYSLSAARPEAIDFFHPRNASRTVMWSDETSNPRFASSAASLLSNGEKNGERNDRLAAMTSVGQQHRKIAP
jgi:hypothetical protein